MSHPQTKESLFSVTYSTILLTVNTCISNYSKSYYVQKMNQDVYQYILLTAHSKVINVQKKCFNELIKSKHQKSSRGPLLHLHIFSIDFS
jgi:hypothetical protein